MARSGVVMASSLVLIFYLLVQPYKCTAQVMVGRLSETQPASSTVQAICNAVQDEVEAIARVKYHTFQAVSYGTQLVAGINYFIKVDVGGDNFVHLRVFQSWQHDITLSDVQLDKRKEDVIEYF
ncbi:cystatin-B-like isoform X2 [Branchiostoma floridae x Branchiostoma belcheri]